jgi:hypothetical protein
MCPGTQGSDGAFDAKRYATTNCKLLTPNRQSFGWQQAAADLNYAGLSATAAGAAVCTREIDSLNPASFTVWVADCLPSTTHLLTPSSPLYSSSPAPGSTTAFSH